MFVHRRNTTASPWPFWLLLLAWFCASYPLAANYAVVWLVKAQAFSHQQRLTAQVARVLGGEKTPVLLEGLKTLPTAPLESSVPGTASAKKIELATEVESSVIGPAADEAMFPEFSVEMAGALRAPPPHGPPREAKVS